MELDLEADSVVSKMDLSEAWKKLMDRAEPDLEGFVEALLSEASRARRVRVEVSDSNTIQVTTDGTTVAFDSGRVQGRFRMVIARLMVRFRPSSAPPLLYGGTLSIELAPSVFATLSTVNTASVQVIELVMSSQPDPAQSSVAPDSPSSVAPAGAGAPSSGPRVNAGIGQDKTSDSEEDPTKKDPP